MQSRFSRPQADVDREADAAVADNRKLKELLDRVRASNRLDEQAYQSIQSERLDSIGEETALRSARSR